MHGKGLISIWFFIGVLLTAYGIIITASGIYELFSPPAHPVVMANLHAGIWWGAVLLAIGLFYTIKFLPKKRQ
ncbi:MAG TPA: hypothetical protein VHZ55_09210 [Bryobacteraceae bacterium]|jgi:hypothetical protein|nr:hypothetical protein [Bryobacteraceae bacterium]